MSALPRFFLVTAVLGFAMWLSDAPHPFPMIGLFVLGASTAGLALALAYVRAYLPARWRDMTAGMRRLMAPGATRVQVRSAGLRAH